MKKSLFAIAAVTAFAGAAQAQSSVTVYGIMDVGYIGGNNRGYTGTTQLKNTYNQFGGGAESSNRLGFRGTEDLGGGLNAFFTIEVQLNPNEQTNMLAGNRQTFAGLRSKGLGQFALGTQNTTIHNAVGITSAGQQNNMVGDVIYPIAPPGQSSNGMVGAGTFGSTASGANNGNSGSAGTSGGYTVRTNNMLTVRTDNFKGLVGNAFYTMADNNSTPTGSSATSNVTGTNNKNGWGIGANYTFQKLLLTANYQSLKAVQTGLGNTNIGVWSGTAAANNIQDNQMYFAAAYDFGILNAYVQYIDRKATSELNSSNFARRSAQQIGARGFFTKTIEGWASVGMGRYDTFGTTAPTVNFTGYQLGTNYYLSKRSNLYAIFGSTAQSSANVNQPSSGMNNYAVGVRHTF